MSSSRWPAFYSAEVTWIPTAVDTGVPMLAEARSLIDSFHSMIRKKIADDLEPQIICASKSLVASFANGIQAAHTHLTVCPVRGPVPFFRQTAA